MQSADDCNVRTFGLRNGGDLGLKLAGILAGLEITNIWRRNVGGLGLELANVSLAKYFVKLFDTEQGPLGAKDFVSSWPKSSQTGAPRARQHGGFSWAKYFVKSFTLNPRHIVALSVGKIPSNLPTLSARNIASFVTLNGLESWRAFQLSSFLTSQVLTF